MNEFGYTVDGTLIKQASAHYYLKRYGHYRTLLYLERDLMGRGKKISLFNRERHLSLKELLQSIERVRNGSVPEFAPKIPLGCWLLRWLEVLHIFFPDQLYKADKLDTNLVSEAFSFYCSEKLYPSAALIARLSTQYSIPMTWPSLPPLPQWKVEHIFALMKKIA